MRSRRFAKWLGRVALSVVLFLIIRTAWLVGERRNQAEGEKLLNAAIAEAEAHDPNWTWELLNTKGRKPLPTGSENGADLIMVISNTLPKQWDDNFGDLEQASRIAGSNRYLKTDQYETARQKLAKLTDGVNQSLRFRGIPNGRREIALADDWISTPLPDTQNTRRVCALLRWRAELLIRKGDDTGAVESLQALLNASRSIGDEPAMISQLVRMTGGQSATEGLERLLGCCEITAEHLAALQTMWVAEAEEPLFYYGVRGDRAGVHHLLQNLTNGTISPDTIQATNTKTSASWFSQYAWWLYRGRIPKDHAWLLHYYNQGVIASQLPFHEQAAALAAIPPPPNESDYKLSQLFALAFEKIASANCRSAALLRMGAVAAACERVRLATGHWPTTLQAIPNHLLASVPPDPFDG